MNSISQNKSYISYILLAAILLLTVIIIISNLFSKKSELLTNDIVRTNDIPVNDISYDNELELTVPDTDMVFNPHGHTRPSKRLPHQNIDNQNLEDRVDENTVYVNTSGDTPLVYSLDRLDMEIDTKQSYASPSITPIDTGSGEIITTTEINNNNMNNLQSIE